MSNSKRNLQGKDVFERMNFLLQASILMVEKNHHLSQYYGNLYKTIGKRAVKRVHLTIKRKFCKRCGIPLKRDVTAKHSPDATNMNFTIQCIMCDRKHKYNINTNYQCWLDNPQSVVESNLEEKTKNLSLEENK